MESGSLFTKEKSTIEIVLIFSWSMRPNLFLIPCPISENSINTIPQSTIGIIHKTSYFIAERAKTARAFLKETSPPYEMKDIHVEELNKHDKYDISEEAKAWLDEKKDIGLLSEAGCPCVADPGFALVNQARSKGYNIKPLVGPSSLLLALMASGMNGQQFTFHGYLPIDQNKLKQKLRQMEDQVIKSGYAQIFIETPYRNEKIIEVLLKQLKQELKLCIALDITGAHEKTEAMTLKAWKTQYKRLQLHKIPAVYVLGV